MIIGIRKELNQDDKVKVANLTWNGDYVAAQSESIDENDEFYKGFGFSDQCYLIKTHTLKSSNMIKTITIT